MIVTEVMFLFFFVSYLTINLKKFATVTPNKMKDLFVLNLVLQDVKKINSL